MAIAYGRTPCVGYLLRTAVRRQGEATMTDTLQRPPSLREFLDAGGDLTDPGVPMKQIREDLFHQLRLSPRSVREESAMCYRYYAEELLAGREIMPAFTLLPGAPPRVPQQKLVTAFSWLADLYEDSLGSGELARRATANLPEILVREGEQDFDLWRRPHPLTVEMPPEWWQCQSCGVCFDQGQAEALCIGERPGHSDDLPYEVYFCAPCVRMAADAMGPTLEASR